MATPTSQSDYLQLYRSAFDSCREELKDFLTKNRVYKLLLTYGALDEKEKREIDKLYERRLQVRETLECVRAKDTLRCYIGFSRVVKECSEPTCRQVFPFVHCLRDGHPPLTKRVQTTEHVDTISLSRDDAAVVVWLVASKVDEEAVCQVLKPYHRDSALSPIPARFKDLHFKEFSLNHRTSDDVGEVDCFLLNPIQVCLIAPQRQFPDARTITALLECISPKVQCAILGGTCVANEGQATVGDVMVATTKKELPFIPELRYLTELWRLKDKAWHDEPIVSDKRPRSRREQALALARLYVELNSPAQHRSKWFKSLNWDDRKPPSHNPALCQVAPMADEIWKARDASVFWTPVEEDVLPFSPSASLRTQARSSMLYAPSTFPLPLPTTGPEVVFGEVANYTHKEATVAFSQEAFSFNTGAKKVSNLKYVAAMGVRKLAEGCEEPEYRQYGSYASAVYLHKVLLHLSTELQ